MIKEGHDKISVRLIIPGIHSFQTVVCALYLEPKSGKLFQ